MKFPFEQLFGSAFGGGSSSLLGAGSSFGSSGKSSNRGYTGSSGSSRNRTGDVIPKGTRSGQLQQFTPEQMELFRQIFSHAGPESYLSRLAGGDESLFEETEAPALRQFGALQGNIASRFSGGSGRGSLGLRRSSGFQNEMGQQASNFSQDLAARRQGLQRQALQDLMGLSESLLGQRPQQRFLIKEAEKGPSFLQSLGGGALRAGGTAAGAYFGGPAGAGAGYQAGNAFANAFGV